MSIFAAIIDEMTDGNTDYRIKGPTTDSGIARSSNRERSGYRDLTLSKIARPIGEGADKVTDSARFIDGDLMGICSKCAKVVVFCEGSADPNKKIRFTSQLANTVSHEAWAVKVIHQANDASAPLVELLIVENGTQEVYRNWEVSVQTFQVLVENLIKWHSMNDCSGYNSTRGLVTQ